MLLAAEIKTSTIENRQIIRTKTQKSNFFPGSETFPRTRPPRSAPNMAAAEAKVRKIGKTP